MINNKKTLLNEILEGMDVNGKYSQAVLHKIEDDFRSLLVDELDKKVDEIELKKCFIALFNKVSMYKKMFAEDRSNILELIQKQEKLRLPTRFSTRSV